MGIEEGAVQPRLYPYWGPNAWHAWDHINFFTADTLERMLRRAGFLHRVKYLIDPQPFAEAGRKGDTKSGVKLTVARWLVHLLGGRYNRWALFAVAPR